MYKKRIFIFFDEINKELTSETFIAKRMGVGGKYCLLIIWQRFQSIYLIALPYAAIIQAKPVAHNMFLFTLKIELATILNIYFKQGF